MENFEAEVADLIDANFSEGRVYGMNTRDGVVSLGVIFNNRQEYVITFTEGSLPE